MKDEFIATVSHELRTPLTSIHGSLSLLDSGMAAKSPDKSAELIRIARANSQRLVRLIDDISSIAKLESEKIKFQLRPLNLAELVPNAVEANQEYAKRYGVHLRMDRAGTMRACSAQGSPHTGTTNLLSEERRGQALPCGWRDRCVVRP